MRTILKLLVIILICNTSQAQIAIRGYYYQPLYDFGFFMKPTASVEIGYLPDFKEGHSRINASITYLKLKPTQAAFHNYTTTALTIAGTYKDKYNYTRTYQDYEIFQAFLGWDFALIKKERFQFYIGPGLTVGILTDIHTDVDENGYPLGEGLALFKRDGVFLSGLRHHVGIQFKINDQMKLIASAQTCYWLNPKELFGMNQANDVGIGIQYLFWKKATKQ